jgi:acyl-coenzyme A thioesterase PaaI-like protein
VQTVDNSISYLRQVTAVTNGVPTTSMINRAGSKVTVSTTTVQSAMEDFRSDVGAGA